jgi:hypothetical protein
MLIITDQSEAKMKIIKRYLTPVRITINRKRRKRWQMLGCGEGSTHALLVGIQIGNAVK